VAEEAAGVVAVGAEAREEEAAAEEAPEVAEAAEVAEVRPGTEP
jgi:hypothetical protein